MTPPPGIAQNGKAGSHRGTLAIPNISSIDDATAPGPIPEERHVHYWSPPTRTTFRFAFCYLGGYCLCSGNATIWGCIPFFGRSVEVAFCRVFALPAEYLAGHLFHVAPPGDRLHPTGSGDTAIIWIAVLLLLLVSLLATGVWTALDRRRPNYQTLAAWLRFLIRLTLAVGMVSYGLAKVFPLQMRPPTISALSEPFGMHSPMSLLWNFIGFNTPYETICGGAELLAGLLLLFRRTALAGALFTAFVVSNVLLFNLAFDVPVKLYAGHLLLLSLFVILPDAGALFRFFWMHQPAHPTGVWVPPAKRRAFRKATVVFEVSFAVLALGSALLGSGQGWRSTLRQRAQPCPLCGDWHIDSATLVDSIGNTTQRWPQLDKGEPAAELILNRADQAVLRDAADDATYISIKTNIAAHTIEFDLPDQAKIVYSAASPDARHLVLTPTAAAAQTYAILHLTLLTPAGGYPLMTRGFHWVSEYPYQH